MSFTQRIIQVAFTLASNAGASTGAVTAGQAGQTTFAGTNGANRVLITGARIIASVVEKGQRALPAAQLRIYGMTFSQMNQLATWGALQTQISATTIDIITGDTDNGLSTIFTGSITDAGIDFTAMPDVCFVVSAFSAAASALNSFKPTSYKGNTSVATILGDIAQRSGRNFENNGVTTRLANQYLSGTAIDQIETCARNANIEFAVTDSTLAIWPKGKQRQGAVPRIAPDNGLIGYPTFFQLGISLTMEHRAGITIGTMVEVYSSLTQACGNWIVFGMTHEISSETPGGPWFTHLECAKPGSTPVGAT